LTPMAVAFHTRLTRPIIGLVLVLMGLAVILRDQNRNVIISAGRCLVMCAIFFTACYSCKMLGDNDILRPALSAWMPILGFGPVSCARFDAVHTGDKETGRQGDRETLPSLCLPVSLSPCLPTEGSHASPFLSPPAGPLVVATVLCRALAAAGA